VRLCYCVSSALVFSALILIWYKHNCSCRILSPSYALSVFQVVVRDIVSKLVIAQFRAHKSPISALCFDSSGTLLVTASIQGHNINVFKIMPGLQGSSSTGASYVHLYRLQRGFTNAVRSEQMFSFFFFNYYCTISNLDSIFV
jgi:hypothetical protein